MLQLLLLIGSAAACTFNTPMALDPTSNGFCAPDAPNVFCNVTILQKTFTNTSVAFWMPKEVQKSTEDDFFDDDIIHQKSLQIAAFVAQLIVFLMAYSIATADLEQPLPLPQPLHKAREVQLIPLPSRQNVRIVRIMKIKMESNC